MSKGPFTARINQIDTAENFHILQVEQLTEQFFHGQKETLKVPVDERLSSLRSGDVITYYRAEEEYVITETPHSEERVVLLFKRSSDGLGLPEKRCLWIAPGKPLMQLPDLPRIVQILLGLSSYYGKREDLVRAALDILALSQDAEAIDALFSIRPDLLDKLLGMEYAVVSVQVADSLIALALAGADLEHPRRRDLRQILSLALSVTRLSRSPCCCIRQKPSSATARVEVLAVR